MVSHSTNSSEEEKPHYATQMQILLSLLAFNFGMWSLTMVPFRMFAVHSIIIAAVLINISQPHSSSKYFAAILRAFSFTYPFLTLVNSPELFLFVENLSLLLSTMLSVYSRNRFETLVFQLLNLLGWVVFYGANFYSTSAGNNTLTNLHFTRSYNEVLRSVGLYVFVMTLTFFFHKKPTPQVSPTIETRIASNVSNKDLTLVNSSEEAAHQVQKEVLQKKAEVFQKKEVALDHLSEDMLLRFSHETRNPLNSLMGMLELIDSQIHDSKIKKLVSHAKICSETLLQLLNNVSDSNKIGNCGSIDITPTYVRTKEYFVKTCTMLELLFKNKGLVPQFKISKRIPSVIKIDATRLNQILLNLCTNAAKYTQNGTVTVRIDYLKTSEIRPNDYKPKHSFAYTASTLSLNEKKVDTNPSLEFSSTEYRISGFRNDRFNSTKSIFTKYILSERNISSQESQVLTEECNIIEDEELLTRIDHEHAEILQRQVVRDSSVFSRDSARMLPKIPISIETSPLLPGIGYLKIEIRDTGCGMTQQEMARIFDKFQRVNQEDRSRRIGTGLGLWITKHICNQLEGGIEVFSKKGSGTCFTVILRADTVDEGVLTPMAKRSSRHKPDARLASTKVNPFGSEKKNPMLLNLNCNSEESECDNNVLKALVVEDNLINSQINKQFLTQCGFAKVDVAFNGQEGYEMFSKKPPGYYDIITMDMDMPVMNGKECIINIRRTEKERRCDPVPILMITGHATQQQKEECLAYPINVTRFLSKPLGLLTLKSILIELGFGEENHKSKTDIANLELVRENSRVKDLFILFVIEESFETALLKSSIWSKVPKAEFATSYAEAENFFENVFDAVFVDCSLSSGKKGVDFMMKLQRYIENCPKRPLLMGIAEEYEEVQSDNCGGLTLKGVIRKPVNIDQIVQVLNL